jgi:hypothetical protein
MNHLQSSSMSDIIRSLETLAEKECDIDPGQFNDFFKRATEIIKSNHDLVEYNSSEKIIISIRKIAEVLNQQLANNVQAVAQQNPTFLSKYSLKEKESIKQFYQTYSRIDELNKEKLTITRRFNSAFDDIIEDFLHYPVFPDQKLPEFSNAYNENDYREKLNDALEKSFEKDFKMKSPEVVKNCLNEFLTLLFHSSSSMRTKIDKLDNLIKQNKYEEAESLIKVIQGEHQKIIYIFNELPKKINTIVKDRPKLISEDSYLYEGVCLGASISHAKNMLKAGKEDFYVEIKKLASEEDKLTDEINHLIKMIAKKDETIIPGACTPEQLTQLLQSTSDEQLKKYIEEAFTKYNKLVEVTANLEKLTTKHAQEIKKMAIFPDAPSRFIQAHHQIFDKIAINQFNKLNKELENLIIKINSKGHNIKTNVHTAEELNTIFTKILDTTSDDELKTYVLQSLKYVKDIMDLSKKISGNLTDDMFISKLGIKLETLIGTKGSIVPHKVPLAEFIMTTLPEIKEKLKNSTEINLIISLSDNFLILNEANPRHSHHAIYLSLTPPYSLQDVNLPNLDEIQSNSFEEFQMNILGWFKAFPYGSIEKVLLVTEK